MALIEATIEQISPLAEPAMAAARARQDQLTKPPGSLGRLEALSVWLAGVRADPKPLIGSPVMIVAAADHGVTRAGVSAYPAEVTAQMVLNFLAGGAAVCVLARSAGAAVTVVDAGVATELPFHPDLVVLRGGPGTGDISTGPAMSRGTARQMLEYGIELAIAHIDRGTDLIAVGEMGIGNTTPSAAIVAAVSGRPAVDVTGAGTGLSLEGVKHKAGVIERALAVNRGGLGDGLGLLAGIGGFEIGLLAGVMLGAAAQRVPVILDGFITGAAALIAQALAPSISPFLLASHRSVEPGHQIALDLLGLEPLLDLRLRLGEGTGALLALPIVRAAAAVLNEMATFADAGVSGRADSDA